MVVVPFRGSDLQGYITLQLDVCNGRAIVVRITAMGQLTTHVLDISAGLPAAGLRIEAHSWLDESPTLIATAATGSDGRLAKPLVAGADFRAGRYTLTFYVASYFRARGVILPDPAFIEEAVIRIGIAHPDQHYHVPLLISPWSYSVYRGG
jgi:5-hydroxyisourate hydrolase